MVRVFTYSEPVTSDPSSTPDDPLQFEAERLLGGPAQFRGGVTVVERSAAGVIWRGVVAVFARPCGKSVYAWVNQTACGPEYIAVLKEPPITSQLDAIQAWLHGHGAGKKTISGRAGALPEYP
jgi:hypothetical protein